MNSSKAKGDRAELEAQTLLRDLTGWPARRQLGAGRADDIGDITGIPDTTIQVANWANVAQAVRHKPVDAEAQAARAHNLFAFAMIRLRGGDWRAVMTMDQWATYARESWQR